MNEQYYIIIGYNIYLVSLIASTIFFLADLHLRMSRENKRQCWIDFVEIEVKTEPPNTNSSVGFLREVDPMTRCGLLALHDVNCKRAKHERFMRGYREAEEAQSDFLSSKQPFTALEIKAKLEISTSLITSTLHHEDHIHNISGEHQHINEIHHDGNFCFLSPNNHDSSDSIEAENVVNGCLSSSSLIKLLEAFNTCKLDEHLIMKMGMYEKIMGHFQHFYNDHDNLSITSLLLYPFCAPDVVRTINFWQGVPPLSATISAPKRPIFRSHTIQGSELILGGFAKVFEMLPDCIILFRSISVQHTNDAKVILRAPYTYFFKMNLHSSRKSFSDQGISQQNNDFHGPISFDPVPMLVDVELRGCLEMHFAEDNRIFFIQDHILACNFSVNCTSYEDLVQYMGY